MIYKIKGGGKKIEKKKGILNSIRYFLAPKDLFENIQKLEEELKEIRIAKETEIRLSHRVLEEKERKIQEKELLIMELRKELAEIKINAIIIRFLFFPAKKYFPNHFHKIFFE